MNRHVYQERCSYPASLLLKTCDEVLVGQPALKKIVSGPWESRSKDNGTPTQLQRLSGLLDHLLHMLRT